MRHDERDTLGVGQQFLVITTASRVRRNLYKMSYTNVALMQAHLHSGPSHFRAPDQVRIFEKEYF